MDIKMTASTKLELKAFAQQHNLPLGTKDQNRYVYGLLMDSKKGERIVEQSKAQPKPIAPQQPAPAAQQQPITQLPAITGTHQTAQALYPVGESTAAQPLSLGAFAHTVPLRWNFKKPNSDVETQLNCSAFEGNDFRTMAHHGFDAPMPAVFYYGPGGDASRNASFDAIIELPNLSENILQSLAQNDIKLDGLINSLNQVGIDIRSVPVYMSIQSMPRAGIGEANYFLHSWAHDKLPHLADLHCNVLSGVFGADGIGAGSAPSLGVNGLVNADQNFHPSGQYDAFSGNMNKFTFTSDAPIATGWFLSVRPDTKKAIICFEVIVKDPAAGLNRMCINCARNQHVYPRVSSKANELIRMVDSVDNTKTLKLYGMLGAFGVV